MADMQAKVGAAQLPTWTSVCDFAHRRVAGEKLTDDDRHLKKKIQSSPELTEWYQNARRVYNRELYVQVKRKPKSGPEARGADRVQYFPGQANAIGLARYELKATWRRDVVDHKTWEVQLEFCIGDEGVDISDFNGDELLCVVETKDGAVSEQVTRVHQVNDVLLSIPRRFPINHPRQVVRIELVPYCRLAQEIAESANSDPVAEFANRDA